MSLLSLRKSTPSAEPAQVTVDHFIDDAVNYASGSARHVSNDRNVRVIHCQPLCDTGGAGMRRATFTLDRATTDRLTLLSEQTGISRSRLIRIWASEQTKRDDENLLRSDTV